MIRYLTTALCVALGGCTTLGPDFREPTLEWLVNWQPELYGQLAGPQEQDGEELARWWQRFGDPDLDALVAEVLRENRNLTIAGLRVLEARARLGGAQALRLPQVQQLDASAAYLRRRQRDGLLPASDASFRSYNLGVSIAWELDFWGRFQRSIEAADAAFLASIARQRDLQVLLVAQTASLYYAYRSSALRISIARENAAIQERSFSITRRLFERGQQSELDLQQARTQYLATLATVPDLQRELTQQRNALAALLGRSPGEIAQLAGSAQSLPVAEPVMLREVPAQLLLRRPDVRARAWEAAAQSAQIGIARSELYPAISLFGSFGWTGDSLDVTRDGSGFAAGPALRWNLFDYGRIRANVQVQDARLQQALLAFDAAALEAAREIDDAAVAVIKTAEARSLLRESREAAQRALELADDRYREGYADFQRVLDAQRALFSQAERELINDAAHIAALIALYKALGGGWQPAPLSDMVPPAVEEQLRRREGWDKLLSGSATPASASAASGGSSR